MKRSRKKKSDEAIYKIGGGGARVEKGREQKGDGQGSRGAARFIGRRVLTQDHPSLFSQGDYLSGPMHSFQFWAGVIIGRLLRIILVVLFSFIILVYFIFG